MTICGVFSRAPALSWVHSHSLVEPGRECPLHCVVLLLRALCGTLVTSLYVQLFFFLSVVDLYLLDVLRQRVTICIEGSSKKILCNTAHSFL